MSTKMKDQPQPLSGDPEDFGQGSPTKLDNYEASPIVTAANNEGNPKLTFGETGWVKQQMTDDKGLFQGGREGRMFGRFKDWRDDNQSRRAANKQAKLDGILGKAHDMDTVHDENYTPESRDDWTKHIDPTNPENVMQFQQWWNQNNSDDVIAVDGKFGPQSLDRLNKLRPQVGEPNADGTPLGPFEQTNTEYGPQNQTDIISQATDGNLRTNDQNIIVDDNAPSSRGYYSPQEQQFMFKNGAPRETMYDLEAGSKWLTENKFDGGQVIGDGEYSVGNKNLQDHQWPNK
jgi:hypothetical protein